MDWQLTEADINKDIRVSDVFHFSAIKVQVRHLDHLFSVYVKSMGEHTVCRLEERKHPAEKPAIEFVNDTFNPSGRLERGWFVDLDSRLNEVNDTLKMLLVAVTRGSNYDLSRRRGI